MKQRSVDIMTKLNVVLIFGGESTEHDVSILSAKNIYEAIDGEKFDTSLLYIDRQGRWVMCEKFDDYENPTKLQGVFPVLGESKLKIGDRELRPDVLFPVLHGKNGEDGSVQALAQLLHISLVGCDMTSSALGMDKVTAKRIAAEVGVPVVPYEIYRQGENMPDYEMLCQKLGDTMFVKPSRAGSSVGANKVHNFEEFTHALESALAVDTTVLIEKSLDVRELEVAVLGNPPMHRVSQVGEVVPGADFYSYEDKYDVASTSRIEIPAILEELTSSEVRRQAALLYGEFGCTGLSRVDFFFTPEGTVYFNEINTLPGFTDSSMYPRLWTESGLSYKRLLTELIMTARS